jgi:hypothetical protein
MELDRLSISAALKKGKMKNSFQKDRVERGIARKPAMQ